MTLEQRTQQFWSVLVLAAREQKLISHSMLSWLTGFSEPGIVLHCLSSYCRQHKLPPLDAIAIESSARDEVRGLAAQQSSVFLYDWLKLPAPSEEMFREAMTRDEALERAEADYLDVPCRC
jgi:hypothetical protein